MYVCMKENMAHVLLEILHDTVHCKLWYFDRMKFCKSLFSTSAVIKLTKKKHKMSEFLFYLIFDMCTYMEYLFYPKQKDPMEDMDFYKW